jgi:crotonobetainyl-CoA:carnitine CoA-transferase CaiB-like acyl-CoA transferase
VARIPGDQRSKLEIVLDLKNPETQDVLLHLVETGDVLVHNFRPGVT